MANTYYIDWANGLDSNDGLSEASPKKSHVEIKLNPGDTVLFKRGGFIRSWLAATSGSKEGLITYGAYGEGPNPVFCGSFDASSPDVWIEESPNIWKYNGEVTDEPCNIIFNNGESCGNLRWLMEDLKNQGEWFDRDMGNPAYRRYKRDGASRFGWSDNVPPEGYVRPLYIYSEKNPGEYYDHIEYVTFARFAMSTAVYASYEDLTFINSGVHGVTGEHDLFVENCEFHFIGGACFSRTMRIRFGNGVESFQFPKNVEVTNCLFNNIYDSCITHQGFWGCTPGVDIHYTHNLMMNYGMAAYEVRDHIPIRTSFNDNICIGAGLGFAAQGEEPPRNSEIWPFPMGHHVFLWRMVKQTPDPEAILEIKRNVFYDAPVGAAIYSFIMEEPEKQLDIDDNVYYTTSKKMINRFGEVNYKTEEFDRYVSETGQDKNSRYEKIDIRAAVRKWYKESGKGEVSDETLSFFGI